jgi:[acyl-carrier-protein] S-malonyltransferase
MGKIAFVYPGQGSQRVGMGQDLAQADPALFAQYVLPCDQYSGFPVSRFCLEGPLSSLSQTQIAQPALFASSLALTAYARQLGLTPALVVGHSLGEYTAAVAAGSLSFQEGLALVCARGQVMQRLQVQEPGAMAAVLGLSQQKLRPLCHTIAQRDPVWVTNCNAPEQLVVSGTEQGVLRLIEAVRLQGKGKAIRLPVKGAFHSPLMAPAQQHLRTVMRDLPWRDPSVPLVANVSGRVLTRGAQIHRELLAQITRPVQWVDCVEQLVAQGCDTLIELGSGQVLTKLIRLIAPQVRAVAIETPQQLQTFLQISLSAGEQAQVA